MASATRARSRSQSGPRSGGTLRSRSRGSSSPSPTARSGAAPDAAPSRGSVSPHLRSHSGHGGSFAVQRLVMLEMAAALVVVGWLVGTAALIPAVAAAAVLVVLALVRRRGHSLPEWLGSLLALRARMRRAASTPAPSGIDSGLAPAVECDPSLRTYSFHRGDRRDQRPVGMVGDGGFLTAVLQLESDAGALRAERSRRPLPVALVQDVLEVDGIRLESAQILVHTQPAPALHLPQQSVVVSNYAPLQAQTGAPAVRIMWIALKLDPESCPEAVAARGGGLRGAQKCLVRSAEHLSSRLTGAGFRANLLTEEELTAAIATSACANPMVTAQAAQTGRDEAPQRRTEESSRSWRCDNRRHTTYWVRRWPQLGESGTSLAQLVAHLTAVPALATTFSLTLAKSGRQDVTLAGHLRITGRSMQELTDARRDLEHAARQARTGLVRLDREQLPGTLATLPLGGTR
ncbi:type VII secretion protein EccE [Streptomyces caniscabiei]|uniref:Type VII secretion protein EccE n=1 Tax=Streptomyces caniscabiei TaxID=2746961 RepID=A0A927QL05_9ACTN|nr:type VII secretion protein EccE [Streptomyces caniscabiei]MBD9730046.1 type VII secretion protein EccE [Streptomyces caniscabiei]MDX3515781.1 type VII secretion protein EccE [Streptomyces caniscabiei]MDX3725000.1 type VII secretion protein EccE [Streptomyces caniscabiei]WEO23778.1 type VII secretion protein EccE [Streptomyces caniscabiei]